MGKAASAVLGVPQHSANPALVSILCVVAGPPGALSALSVSETHEPGFPGLT